MSTCPNHTGESPVTNTHKVIIRGYYKPGGEDWYAHLCEDCACQAVQRFRFIDIEAEMEPLPEAFPA